MERRIIRHGTTDSTNERALAALAAGAARHGDVHTAEAQTAGRGSRGRAWHSEPGAGLYASVVWMPGELLSPTVLTMAAGLAARDALASRDAGLGLAGVRLKWPNDVLIGAEKVAGILIEARGLDPARPAFVCGIGVNVAQRAFPAVLLRPATSLALHGVALEPQAVLALLLPHLDARFAQATGAGAEVLAAEFAAGARLLGAVRVRSGEHLWHGELVSFGLDGIALATAAGLRRLALEHVGSLEATDAR
jgi:BirA family biotin operon repressor/biotin-[acetyl-CoA-carboxylase] ligase